MPVQTPKSPSADFIDARVRFTTTQCTTCEGWEQHVYVTDFMTDDGLVTSEVRGLTNANHQQGCERRRSVA